MGTYISTATSYIPFIKKTDAPADKKPTILPNEENGSKLFHMSDSVSGEFQLVSTNNLDSFVEVSLNHNPNSEQFSQNVVRNNEHTPLTTQDQVVANPQNQVRERIEVNNNRTRVRALLFPNKPNINKDVKPQFKNYILPKYQHNKHNKF